MLRGSHTSDQMLLLDQLKRLLRGRGIRYRDVAQHLGVSEATIKRWLAGRGLTLTALEAICGLVDIRLTDLAELTAQKTTARARHLSEEQEQSLADNLFTAFIFLLLRHDWSPSDIQAEFDMDEPAMVIHLRRLEKLRLIELFPGNRIRLLTVRDPEWMRGGPLRRVFDRSLRRHFEDMDFHASDAVWELETAKLSAGSLARLRAMVSSLVQRMRELAAEDRALPRNETEWHTMLAVARPLDPRRFWSADAEAPELKGE